MWRIRATVAAGAAVKTMGVGIWYADGMAPRFGFEPCWTQCVCNLAVKFQNLMVVEWDRGPLEVLWMGHAGGIYVEGFGEACRVRRSRRRLPLLLFTSSDE